MDMMRSPTKQSAPLFSIIIPVYNADLEYFDICVDSILNQSLGNIEIIIVDDGSQRSCAEVCDNYAKRDSRIRVIHQANQGVSAARNNGIREARAEWIFFVDSDDWIEADACKKIYDALISNPCDILLFDHIKEYSSGTQIRRETGLKNNTMYDTADVSTREMLYRRAMGTPNLGGVNRSTIYYSCDKAFRREFILENNLKYHEDLPKSEDKVFILECFERMRSLFYISEALYHYRINSESATYRYSQNADKERRTLSVYLEEISKRMDRELAELTGNPAYALLYGDYMRFMFGIISTVLFSKYYHKDYPGTGRQRNREVRAFLQSEPFRSAIKSCSYRELNTEAKFKKFLLTHGLPTLFCNVWKYITRIRGQMS